MGTSVRDVFQCHGRIQSESLGNGLELLRSERSLRVQVDRLSLGAAVGDCHLTRDAERVTELRLAGAEFTKHLRDRSSFNAPFKQLVQFDRPRRETDQGLAIFEGIGGRFEIHGHHGLHQLLQLQNLGLGNAFDIRQLPDGGMRHRLDRVVSSRIELLDVIGGNPVLLQHIERLV
jgi:hypothetical protein